MPLTPPTTRLRVRLRRVCAGAAAATALFAASALTLTPAAGAATASTTTPSLLFGVYPGGAAGGASGWAPDNVSKDLSATRQLDSSGAPFMAHLYAEYYGPGSYSASQEIGSEVQTFAKAGIKVELVLCYRPTDQVPSTDVPGFVTWAKSALGSLGKYLSYLQVTNEANVSGSSSSNDGSYPGAEDALIQGVEGTKSYIASHGMAIKVGFNWSYNPSVGSDSFWSYMASTGGSTFVKDVDWVGVDVYPGTWQTLSASLSFSAGVSQVMTQAISSTRDTFMPLAALPASVPIHITETGYPTGPNRTYAMQVTALQSEVAAVVNAHTTYNVDAVEFFDLRDAITNSTVIADQYGLMTDQWAPKPAFTSYEQLVTQYAPLASAAAQTASVARVDGRTARRIRHAHRTPVRHVRHGSGLHGAGR